MATSDIVYGAWTEWSRSIAEDDLVDGYFVRVRSWMYVHQNECSIVEFEVREWNQPECDGPDMNYRLAHGDVK